MKTIKIGFSKPNTFKVGAWAIQKWIGKDYSHVYIRYSDDQSRDVVFQAAHGLVHPILFDHFLEHNIPVDEVSLEFSDAEYQQLRNFYYHNMGKPYDYGDLIKIVCYDIAMKFGFKINTIDYSGYICSELAAKMLSDIKGYNFNKAINLVSPSDVEQVLEERYGHS
jgi:hypothetical protein